MSGVEKERIARSFARARHSYELQADLQAGVADHLLTMIRSAESDFSQGRALEIGCCTGILTRRLVRRFPALAELHLNDLVPEFVRMASPRDFTGRIRHWPGDIESLAIPGPFHLIVSSSTLHWLHDLEGFFSRFSRLLHPGGVMAVALYGPENLREIRSLTGQGLIYLSREELRRMGARHLRIIAVEEERKTLWFDDPLAVLHHLRATGVNALSRRGWNRTRLARFQAHYRQRFGGRNGVPLTYHPMYLVGRAKG